MPVILLRAGTAEIVYTAGLVWCQAPFGYALSLMLGTPQSDWLGCSALLFTDEVLVDCQPKLS